MEICDHLEGTLEALNNALGLTQRKKESLPDLLEGEVPFLMDFLCEEALMNVDHNPINL